MRHSSSQISFFDVSLSSTSITRVNLLDFDPDPDPDTDTSYFDSWSFGLLGQHGIVGDKDWSWTIQRRENSLDRGGRKQAYIELAASHARTLNDFFEVKESKSSIHISLRRAGIDGQKVISYLSPSSIII